MASILKVDTIQDQAGNNIINESANTITIGASGDTITIPSGATFASVGIDDNATSTAITISSAEEVTFTEDILLGDGKKAIFGAGSDLQIYHSGKNSIRAVSDAEVELYYNNNLKFETTSTGVDVTGNLTATGNLTSLGIDDNATSTAISIDSSGDVGIGGTPSFGQLQIQKSGSGNSGGTLVLTNEDGSISDGQTLGNLYFVSLDNTSTSTRGGVASIKATASEDYTSSSGANLSFFTHPESANNDTI